MEGQSHIDSNIKNYINIMYARWDGQKETIPWWKIWKRRHVGRITEFLLNALDELIAYVDQLDISGVDKKATVLAVISILYDYGIKEVLPIWAKPFSGKIKNYIIYVMISTAIDWIVEKYRNGVWTKKSAAVMASEWSTQAALRLVKH